MAEPILIKGEHRKWLIKPWPHMGMAIHVMERVSINIFRKGSTTYFNFATLISPKFSGTK
jgi:hypothetical protein